MIGAPAIGTALEVRVYSGVMRVRLVREDASQDPTYRYVLRVEDDPRGKFGQRVDDEFTVEDKWFEYRSTLWPREGGVRVADPCQLELGT